MQAHRELSASQTQFAVLSHLRWAAAFLVAISHVRNLFMDDFHGGSLLQRIFYFVTGYGHAGVVVFFVLSGFLVGRKVRELIADPSPSWGKYLNDRFSRIFIVFWPAVALSVICLCLATFLAPEAKFVTIGSWSATLQEAISNDWSLARWLGLIVLLNEVATPTPAINGPLWSLAYEWLYYIVALASVLVFRKIWSRSAAIVIIYAFVLVAASAVYKPAILLSGLIWCAGMAASYVSDAGWLKGRWTFFMCLTLASLALIVWRVAPVSDLILGAVIAILISHYGWRTWVVGARWADYLAGFSYSLYVTHFPICVVFLALLCRLNGEHRLDYGLPGIALISAVLGVCLLSARLFASLTEDRTWMLKRTIARIAAHAASPKSPGVDAG